MTELYLVATGLILVLLYFGWGELLSRRKENKLEQLQSLRDCMKSTVDAQVMLRIWMLNKEKRIRAVARQKENKLKSWAVYKKRARLQ